MALLEDLIQSAKQSLRLMPLIAFPLVIGCGESEPPKVQGADPARVEAQKEQAPKDLSDLQARVLDALGFYNPIACQISVNAKALEQLPQGSLKTGSGGSMYWSEEWAEFLAANNYLAKDDQWGHYWFGPRTGELLGKNALFLSDFPSSVFTHRYVLVGVAKRKLEAISDVESFDRKEFQLPVIGPLDREIYTFKFKYKIETLLSELPNLDQTFVGRGTVTKNVTTEEWELARSSLGDYDSKLYDTGIKAFSAFLKSSAEETKRKIEAEKREAARKKEEELLRYQENFSAQNLNAYQDLVNAILTFDLEGGKPPFKFNVEFNGEPLDVMLNKYKSIAIGNFGWKEEKPLYDVRITSKEKFVDYAKGGKVSINISTNHDWDFAFPPDMEFPIKAKITVFDSASRKITLEKIIENGRNNFVSPEPKDTYKWIEIGGEPHATENLEGKHKITLSYFNPYNPPPGKSTSDKIITDFIADVKQQGARITGKFTEKNIYGSPATLTGNIIGVIKGRRVEFTKTYENIRADPAEYKGYIINEKLVGGSFEVRGKIFDGEWNLQRISLPKKDGSKAPVRDDVPGKYYHVLAAGKIGDFTHGTLVSKTLDTLVVARSEREATHTHAGVDVVSTKGTGVYPLADGTVLDIIVAENDPDWRFLGYMVVIQHDQCIRGKDTYSTYLHLNVPPSVKKGEKVVEGRTLLGKVGSTGAATGPHTHIEVRHFASRYFQNDDWSKPLNIYGKDNQTRTKRFYDNWTDPLDAFAHRFGVKSPDKSKGIMEIHRAATDLINTKKQYAEGVDMYLPILKRLEDPAEAKNFSDEETKNIRMVAFYNIACYWSSAEKNATEALPWLEESFKNDFIAKHGLRTLQQDADLAPLRNNPAFQQLIEKYK